MSDGNSPFLMALGRLDDGLLIERLDEAITRVGGAVRRTGKAGSVTVTISLKPNGPNALLASGKHKVTEPVLPSGESFFYLDANDELTRTPPKDELPSLFEGSAQAVTTFNPSRSR